ncbi:methionine synthase [Kocuria sp. SM24M-10]|uniref:methionine synthase n=1 Tax=Kocuria sp. SM24M-10 TaxID=1660349 RepID=UPI0009E39E06|nr:methionine synthase [Kocuria sp. SM24M-10]
MNTLLPTTIVGSLPKPSWLAEGETLWSPWKLDGEELREGKRDALSLAVNEQQQAGIDIVSDGEQTRQHFVTTFIEHLSGVDFEHRKTVRIRDRYDASVPTVVGAVGRERSVFLEDAKALRARTSRPIKWTLPGPMTMIDTLYDKHYRSREKLAWGEFAKILNQEAKELEAAGVDIIQFDEPAFNVFFDDLKEWGVAALERAAEGLRSKTAVHICYGYGIKANTEWKATLGSEWRQYEMSFPLLQQSTIDMVSLERHNSRVPVELIELLRGKEVMVGAIDVASDAIEAPEEVAGTLRQVLRFVDADKLYPSTNCGMAPLARKVARDKMIALAAGAEIIRAELSGVSLEVTASQGSSRPDGQPRLTPEGNVPASSPGNGRDRTAAQAHGPTC